MNARDSSPQAIDAMDLKLIRESAHQLASKFDLDYWREKDENYKYPWEFINAFAEGGWLGGGQPRASACWTAARASSSAGNPSESLRATTSSPTHTVNSPRPPSISSVSAPVSFLMSAATRAARGR